MALLAHCFQVKLEFGVLIFMEGGKLKGPREELFKQGKEPTRNSTHM